ncbi:DNA polymerase delta subunit 4 [Plecturocebus cupreus]
MGRKRLITDSYPVVKRKEGPDGHSKGELAPELGEEPQPPDQDEDEDEDEAELQLLRQFDLAWQYGPCTGITRLQRWCRAKQLGLEPPPEVWHVLKTHPGDPRFQCRTSCPWLSCSPPKNLRTEGRAHCSYSAQSRCGGTLGRRNLEVFEAQLLHLTRRLPEPPGRASTAEAKRSQMASGLGEKDLAIAFQYLLPASLTHGVAS